jgi:hypothetical protein
MGKINVSALGKMMENRKNYNNEYVCIEAKFMKVSSWFLFFLCEQLHAVSDYKKRSYKKR